MESTDELSLRGLVGTLAAAKCSCEVRLARFGLASGLPSPSGLLGLAGLRGSTAPAGASRPVAVTSSRRSAHLLRVRRRGSIACGRGMGRYDGDRRRPVTGSQARQPPAVGLASEERGEAAARNGGSLVNPSRLRASHLGYPFSSAARVRLSLLTARPSRLARRAGMLVFDLLAAMSREL